MAGMAGLGRQGSALGRPGRAGGGQARAPPACAQTGWLMEVRVADVPPPFAPVEIDLPHRLTVAKANGVTSFSASVLAPWFCFVVVLDCVFFSAAAEPSAFAFFF